MKHLNEVRRIFPNRTCTVRFTENYRSIEVEIRVDDYIMVREFPSDELAEWPSGRENLIEQEFGYMLEAIEGKFNSDKERVQVWREE